MERARILAVAMFLGAVGGLTWSVWAYGYAQAMGSVAARGQSDLALAADRLVTGLLRYRTAAVLLVDHPTLLALHSGGSERAARNFLLESADKTGALATVYASRDGWTLAASRSESIGRIADKPWFVRALTGALGAGLGIDPLTGKRAYYYAVPAFGPDKQVRGVLIMVVNLETLEGAWRGSRPSVFFTDAEGTVFVTNRSEILFWTREGDGLKRPDGRVEPIAVSRVAGEVIWRQALSDYVPRHALHLEQALPMIDMRAEALVDVAPARRVAGLQAAVVAALVLVFGAVLFVVAERRRALARINTGLESRVRARTRDLEGANRALRREVQEREEAEAALRRAQADLVQAGKLSALGQMSAGISHELNQPLMAIRQYAENGTAFLQKGQPERAAENLSRIAGLSHRAARIIRNLRAFARNESEPMGRVDLGQVIESAVELTQARLEEEGVDLRWEPVAEPIFVRAGEVRLGQVFVNLILNAVDAMGGQDTKRIEIEIARGPRPCVKVRDTGPGIKEPERVFEPFYSTKEVGDGMGLGLSISYGLVQSFGGNIRGANMASDTGSANTGSDTASGGAEFTVELDRWPDQDTAGAERLEQTG